MSGYGIEGGKVPGALYALRSDGAIFHARG